MFIRPWKPWGRRRTKRKDKAIMDTVCLPSKYPIYSARPHTLPQPEICDDAMKIAEKVPTSITGILEKHERLLTTTDRYLGKISDESRKRFWVSPSVSVNQISILIDPPFKPTLFMASIHLFVTSGSLNGDVFNNSLKSHLGSIISNSPVSALITGKS